MKIYHCGVPECYKVTLGMLEQPLVMEMTFGLLSKLSRLLVETDALLVKQAEEWSLSMAGTPIKIIQGSSTSKFYFISN